MSFTFEQQVEAKLLALKVNREAQKQLEASALEKLVFPEGVLVGDPLPPEPMELIPGVLLTHGATGIIGQKETGKAQPLDSLVLTPSGWKRMGNLQVGDALASHDGSESHVIAIHPRGVRQVYNVTFSDGRAAEVCAEHLWQVYHPEWFYPSRGTNQRPNRIRRMGPRVLNTLEFIGLPAAQRKNAYIDLPQALSYGNTQKLPIDPWLLGVLLGDGCLSQGRAEFASADVEIVAGVRLSISSDLRVNKRAGKYAYSIVGKAKTNSLVSALKNLGLAGCKSHNKFIPECYLNAPNASRARLVAGLIDTDGYVGGKYGNISFTTVSPVLAQQVAYLVRSLGGICSTKTRVPYFKDAAGNKKAGQLAYTLWISHQTPHSLVTLSRKANRLKARTEMRRLHIASVAPSRITETQCITVSQPEGLYITNDFIVTHNSLIALEIQHSLLTGEPLWGAIRPNKVLKKTVHFLAEHASRLLIELYNRTEMSKDVGLKIYGPEHLGGMKLLVSNGIRREEAVQFYKKLAEGAGLVVFDPIAAFIQGQSAENDNSPMRNLIDSMTEIATSTGASCLVLGHQGKPLIFQGRQIKRGSYATRGASATEDAMAAVHYLDKLPNVHVQGNTVFELRPIFYKGRRQPAFQLIRDQETCRHALNHLFKIKNYDNEE